MEKVQEKQIIEYYKNNINNIYKNIELPRWRQIKCELKNGLFVKSKESLNKKILLRYLIGYTNSIAVKCYVSIGFFRNALKQEGKLLKGAGYKNEVILLHSDFLYDLDGEEAGKDALKIIKFMKQYKDYSLKKIQNTSRGLHLIYNSPRFEEPDPKERVKVYEEKREEILRELPNLKTFDDIHYNISKDQYRVYALEGTIKADTGVIIKSIPLHSFLRLGGVVSRERLYRADDRLTPAKYRGKERTRLISSHNFTDNMVIGMKNRYIISLIFSKLRFRIEKVKELQKRYNLPEFHLIEQENSINAVSTKVIDGRKLQKIMRVAGALNLNTFLKYGHSWIRLDGNYIGKIKSAYGNGIQSRQHNYLFNIDKGVGIEKPRIWKGWEK